MHTQVDAVLSHDTVWCSAAAQHWVLALQQISSSSSSNISAFPSAAIRGWGIEAHSKD